MHPHHTPQEKCSIINCWYNKNIILAQAIESILMINGRIRWLFGRKFPLSFPSALEAKSVYTTTMVRWINKFLLEFVYFGILVYNHQNHLNIKPWIH
jgi:hypothetical protein